MMTADERAPVDTVALREALAAATPGPWEDYDIYGMVAPVQIDGFAFPDERARAVAHREASLRLIAQAVNALPELLAELDHMRDRVNRRNRHGKYDEKRIKTLTAELDAARAHIARLEALADGAASSACVHVNTLWGDLRAALADEVTP